MHAGAVIQERQRHTPEMILLTHVHYHKHCIFAPSRPLCPRLPSAHRSSVCASWRGAALAAASSAWSVYTMSRGEAATAGSPPSWRAGDILETGAGHDFHGWPSTPQALKSVRDRFRGFTLG